MAVYKPVPAPEGSPSAPPVSLEVCLPIAAPPGCSPRHSMSLLRVLSSLPGASPRHSASLLRVLLPGLPLLLALSGCAGKPVAPPMAPAPARVEPRPGHLLFDPAAPVNYRFDRMIELPGPPVSNPSGLAFGGREPDGRVLLWTVCDGSSLVKDGFDPLKTVVKLRIDPTGARAPEADPITLDPRLSV